MSWRGLGDGGVGVGSTAERVLQQTSELGVPVRDVRALGVHESRDDIAKRRQGKVDLRTLFQTVARSPSLGLPLAAGEVDKVELSLPAPSFDGSSVGWT